MRAPLLGDVARDRDQADYLFAATDRCDAHIPEQNAFVISEQHLQTSADARRQHLLVGLAALLAEVRRSQIENARTNDAFARQPRRGPVEVAHRQRAIDDADYVERAASDSVEGR